MANLSLKLLLPSDILHFLVQIGHFRGEIGQVCFIGPNKKRKRLRWREGDGEESSRLTRDRAWRTQQPDPDT